MVELQTKCDLHRHMGGSISHDTVLTILRRTNRADNIDVELVRQQMVCDLNNIGFDAFLKKFDILNKIPWPKWAIDIAIKQICDDLKSEGIKYSEISFSINKYVDVGWNPIEIISHIGNKFEKYSSKRGIKTALLLSLQYHKPKEQQIAYSDLIKEKAVREIVCGIDLVGDERYYDAKFYEPILNKWREYGKVLRAHVGELKGTCDHIKSAIEDLRVDRIAHGIQADDATIDIAIKHGVCFDLALHSNLITGVWNQLKTHPLKRMIQNGCCVTLNTDDPIQFNCTLDDEFQLAIDNNLITTSQANQLMHNAYINLAEHRTRR